MVFSNGDCVYSLSSTLVTNIPCLAVDITKTVSTAYSSSMVTLDTVVLILFSLPNSSKYFLVIESSIPKSKSGTCIISSLIHPTEKVGPSKTTPLLLSSNASLNPFLIASLVCLRLYAYAVSYTHLTLPTIYSV